MHDDVLTHADYPTRRARRSRGPRTVAIACGALAAIVLFAGCTATQGTSTQGGVPEGGVPEGDGAAAAVPGASHAPPTESALTEIADPGMTTAPESDTADLPGGATTPSSPADSGAGSGASDGQDPNADLRAAGQTAAGAVDSGTVISIESENDATAWEVKVVAPDGTQYELKVSRDGSDIVAGPTDHTDSDTDRAKYRDRIGTAKLGYGNALDTIAEYAPGARVDELELDTSNGVLVWEADVYDSSGVKQKVEVDAVTGEISRRG